ncbi:peroxidase [Musa troglodytarum]|uniref:peroxidase n=1 Tax=Musa troglodytarum TaxID=320322 RepID=A0A9E7F375_9LILI|nr:peroxidase [Musa troglodytarum]
MKTAASILRPEPGTISPTAPASMAYNFLFLLSCIAVVSSSSHAYVYPPLVEGLSFTFYKSTCPDLESIVRSYLKQLFQSDISVASGLLRLHFHDCFVQGCDGSILLDGSFGGPSEKDAPPNLTLRPAAFKAIDELQTLITQACGPVVSCADIAALAARDSVRSTGGPKYKVPLGRRDGLSYATEEDVLSFLPSPTSNVTALIDVFTELDLTIKDLVTLSGAHTIGIAHCSSFEDRLFPTQDSTLDPIFAEKLYLTCPALNSTNTTVIDIRTPNTFDNKYFVDLLHREGLFTSDQGLYDDSRTKPFVIVFALCQRMFFENFVYSMTKMGQLSVLTGSQGDIRRNCSALNSNLSWYAVDGDGHDGKDPTLDQTFAENLYLTCPVANTSNTTALDVRSPDAFDNNYYVDLLNSQGLFTSDQGLYADARTQPTVTGFAVDQSLFFDKFVYSMTKMGQLSVLTGDQGWLKPVSRTEQALLPMAASLLLWLLSCVAFLSSSSEAYDYPPLVDGLSFGFYKSTCPSLKSIVRKHLKQAFENDVGLAAGLLRLHFHDCFVQGCDGSILLDGSAGGPSEKDAPPNLTLRPAAFEAINDLQAVIAKACGQVVSCADIAALAARYSVRLSGGPSYKVPLGRRDGLSFATRNDVLSSLPAPTSNVTDLLDAFGKLDLDADDLVALSGGHTIGIGHCTSFEKRLFPTQDSTLDQTFADNLYLTCPVANTTNTTVLDVRSPDTFDNKYYVDLLNRQGLFTSDQDLYTDSRTQPIVERFAAKQSLFFKKFVFSITKMGQLSVLTGNQGEIRSNCSAINSSNNLLSSSEGGRRYIYSFNLIRLKQVATIKTDADLDAKPGEEGNGRDAAACLAMDLSPIQNAVASGSYATIADACDELMLQVASRGIAYQEDWPFTVHLLGHIFANDLNSARFLWKSIPQGFKESKPELVAAWRIGQCLWTRDYAGVYDAIRGFEWSPEVAGLVAAFSENYTKKMFQLLSSAYSTIGVADVAHFLGMSEDEATNYALQHGWTMDSPSKMLTVKKPRIITEQKLDPSRLQRLTEYVFHLEH